MNRKIFDFLNVTFNLTEVESMLLPETERPTTLHQQIETPPPPPAILGNLPATISKRLSSISFDKATFFYAAPDV